MKTDVIFGSMDHQGESAGVLREAFSTHIEGHDIGDIGQKASRLARQLDMGYLIPVCLTDATEGDPANRLPTDGDGKVSVYAATVYIAVIAEHEAEACDAISESLTGNLMSGGAILDWQYTAWGDGYTSPEYAGEIGRADYDEEGGIFGRIPVKSPAGETRVYVIGMDDLGDEQWPDSLSDERFMELAERNGSIYSLDGFVRAFNEETVSSSNDFIRFIHVNTV